GCGGGESWLASGTVRAVRANFADPAVGAVATDEIHLDVRRSALGRGEGLYWRYEKKLKQLEDRIGSTVSASGRLFGMRRELYTPSAHSAVADDFALSTGVILADRRLAFDAQTHVMVTAPSEGGTELFRK